VGQHGHKLEERVKTYRVDYVSDNQLNNSMTRRSQLGKKKEAVNYGSGCHQPVGDFSERGVVSEHRNWCDGSKSEIFLGQSSLGGEKKKRGNSSRWLGQNSEIVTFSYGARGGWGGGGADRLSAPVGPPISRCNKHGAKRATYTICCGALMLA